MLFPWEPVLGAKGIAFNRRGMTVSGPPTIGGRTQVSQQDAGYWVATLDRMVAAGPARVKAYRRLMGLLEGGAHQTLVPAFDQANAPWPVEGVYGADPTGFTDGTEFTDGTGFFEPAILVSVGQAASLRATQLTITVEEAGDIVGGELFEIGVGRLHVITAVLEENGSDLVVSIWPPLRKAVSAGEPLNFDEPKCLMRLAGEGADDLSLEMGRYGFPSVSFIEVVDIEDDAEENTDVSCLRTQREVTDSGDIVLAGNCEDVIIINKTANETTQVTLPPSASRVGRKKIRIVDGKGNAQNYNITIVPAAGETLQLGSSYIIDSNGASFECEPRQATVGWF